jgi:hypothetical protein
MRRIGRQEALVVMIREVYHVPSKGVSKPQLPEKYIDPMHPA